MMTAKDQRRVDTKNEESQRRRDRLEDKVQDREEKRIHRLVKVKKETRTFKTMADLKEMMKRD